MLSTFIQNKNHMCSNVCLVRKSREPNHTISSSMIVFYHVQVERSNIASIMKYLFF
ncbi:hypothetical protein YC2023_045936 [Brassica napus]